MLSQVLNNIDGPRNMFDDEGNKRKSEMMQIIHHVILTWMHQSILSIDKVFY